MRPAQLIPLIFALTVAAQEPQTPRFEVVTRLVVVNVEVKDRDGRPVRGLMQDDFHVFEDGARQKISVFEFQELDQAPAPAPEAPAEQPVTRRAEITPSAPGQVRYRDRRLIVLFFDLSSMPPEDQIRAQTAAEKFVAEQMTPVDLVAVMAFSNRLRVLQDFSHDRDLLSAVIRSLRIGEASELAVFEEGDVETAEDTGAAFTADDAEFNIFNTDRKLSALETAARMLASLPEKKALVYFSSGVGRTGMENQSQLQSTINAAVKANVAFYSVDARGLVAEAPLGDARRGGARGSSMYSGDAQRARRDTFLNQQETLFTLAADTGGKALLDSNNLSMGIVQAQQDMSSYYILGYYATNPAEDGKYRRIRVETPAVRNARLDYRRGYFAPKRFEHFTESDKERQLEEALLLEDPITDLPVALEVNYFRRAGERYIVPVALKVPGLTIALARRRGAETTRLDFIGQVRNANGALISNVRDHIQVRLAGAKAEVISQRHLQYDTAFTLPPGEYALKFLVRENETGRMGTFETRFTVPDLRAEKSYLRLSSVVWANQREVLTEAVGEAERNRRLMENQPLVREGAKLIPSITRVFRQDQDLHVYFEVYDPGFADRDRRPSVTANVSFFRGNAKTFESAAVRPDSPGQDRAGFVPMEFRVPLKDLEEGQYVCQLTVIDELGQKFAFRRVPIVVLRQRASAVGGPARMFSVATGSISRHR